MAWLFSKKLCESLHYLPGQVAEYLEVIFSDGAQFVQWSEMPMQPQFSLRDKMTKACPFSRFGVTSPHLTADLGEAVLMSYLEAFHAKIYPQQEKGQELTEREAAFGVRSRELLARFDQDTFSWKTPQCSLLEGLDEFLGAWPQWGMMQNGVSWGLTMSVRPIKESGFGYSQNWATPTTMDALPPKSIKALKKEATHDRRMRSRPDNLRDQVSNMENWADIILSIGDAVPMETQTKIQARLDKWPTPKVQDSRHASWDRGKCNLGEVVAGQSGGGKLNPDWTEWLMNWPLGWTKLETLNNDSFEFWKKSSAEAILNGGMCQMWFARDPATPPQRQESTEQFPREYRDTLPEVPQGRPYEGWNLGQRESGNVNLQSMRESVSAKESAEGFNMQQTLPTTMGENFSPKALEYTPRVSENNLHRVDRIRAIGNGQVSAVAATAWNILSRGFQ